MLRIEYRQLETCSLIQLPQANLRNRVCIPTEYGDCCFCSFNKLIDNKEHLALVFNNADKTEIPEVRIHSECMTGDLFQSKRCDYGDQLQEVLSRFHEHGGILLYLRQEGRGIGLYNKLDAYSLQLKGLDTYEANRCLNFLADMRSYEVAVQMLHALNVSKIRLITNNPEKVKQVEALGIDVVERIKTGSYIKPENHAYLRAKVNKTGHWLKGL